MNLSNSLIFDKLVEANGGACIRAAVVGYYMDMVHLTKVLFSQEKVLVTQIMVQGGTGGFRLENIIAISVFVFIFVELDKY